MTTSQRFERDLPARLTDLAAERRPDYLDETFYGRVAATRQRPAWVFPERWLPMADITTRPALVPRVPWRTMATALLILALLIATAAVYVGSQRTRVPAPFGVAENGLIAVSREGDLFMMDPVDGTSTPIVVGPTVDASAQVSPDGTRVAFVRERVEGTVVFQDLVVAGIDGSNPTVITPRAVIGGFGMFAWSPDSGSILADLDDNDEIRIYDVSGTNPPAIIVADALTPDGPVRLPGLTTYLAPFQPPDGSAILIQRQTRSGVALIRLDLGSMAETILAEGDRKDDLGAARWSPDGTRVVYNASPDAQPSSQRLFVVNADGTGRKQITDAPGTAWYEIDPTWSPTGDRIAFTRYKLDRGAWDIEPTGVYDLEDGTVRDVGPLPRETRAARPSAGDADATAGEGFWIEWSPDGKSLIAIPGEGAAHPVIIDVATGAWRNLDPIVEPEGVFQSWQRKAP